MIPYKVQTITVPELLPGYLLGYHGMKMMARDIQYFQKLKFPKEYVIYQDIHFFLWMLNHVGHIDRDYAGDVLVYEQRMPGKYIPDRLTDEYLNSKGDVWIGVPRISNEELAEKMRGLRVAAEQLVADGKLLNYSYKSIIGFAINAVWYRWTKKELWLTGIPKGTTCSQAEAKLYQEFFKFFTSDPFYSWFPCELFMDDKIELRKLIY